MSDELRIESLKVENIKGLTSFEVNFGDVTIIRGDNGVGKSSLLMAIASPFDSEVAHDPKFLRLGADKAVVQMKLSNGDSIIRTVTEKGTYLDAKTATGAKIKAPATYMKELAKRMSFSPAKFIHGPSKDRLKYLMENLDIEFTTDELREALRDRAPLTQADLETVNGILEGLLDERRDVNRDMKTADATITRLEKSLPGDEETDWVDKAQRLGDEIAECRSALDTARTDIDRQKEGLIHDAENKATKEIDALQQQIAAIAHRCVEEKAEVAEKAEKVYEEGVTEIRTKLEDARAKEAEAKAKADESQRAGVIREELERSREIAGEKQMLSDDLTRCVESIRKLKTAKLQDLPVEGMDVRDGELYIGELPFDAINASEQLLVAVQLSTIGMGRLKTVIIDDAEKLSPKRFKMLVDAYQGSGYQVALTRVTEGDLEVVTLPEQELEELSS